MKELTLEEKIKIYEKVLKYYTSIKEDSGRKFSLIYPICTKIIFIIGGERLSYKDIPAYFPELWEYKPTIEYDPSAQVWWSVHVHDSESYLKRIEVVELILTDLRNKLKTNELSTS